MTVVVLCRIHDAYSNKYVISVYDFDYKDL